MWNENRKNISTKESLVFCLSGGIFIYFIASIPRILFYLFPPTQVKGLDTQYYVPPAPNKYAFIISFGILTILGIRLLGKLNFKNRLAHFSLLALILAIGSGILTNLGESIYYIFIIGNSGEREYFFARLQENYFETILYDIHLISWALVFVIAFIPFTSLFLLTTSLVTKLKIYNSLK